MEGNRSRPLVMTGVGGGGHVPYVDYPPSSVRIFIINSSSLLPDRPEANTFCCHVIHLDIYANIQYVTHALVSSPRF